MEKCVLEKAEESFLMASHARRVVGFADISFCLILAKRWMQIGNQERVVSY